VVVDRELPMVGIVLVVRWLGFGAVFGSVSFPPFVPIRISSR